MKPYGGGVKKPSEMLVCEILFETEYSWNDPDGNRTRVTAVKGRCPRPLDDGALSEQIPSKMCFSRKQIEPFVCWAVGFIGNHPARQDLLVGRN